MACLNNIPMYKSIYILNQIRTTRDRSEMLLLLESLEKSLFTTRPSIKDVLEKSSSSKLLQALNQELTEQKIPFDNTNELNKFITNIRQELEDLKTINITLAIMPTDQIITTLSKWVEKNLKERKILDITISSSILGGSLIAANGKYGDYSVLRKLTDVFANKRTDIMGAINK